MSLRINSVTFDCANPRKLAEFWVSVLGYELKEWPGEELAAAVDPNGQGARLLFLRVPEGKTVKNRVHIDMQPVESTMEDEVARVVKLGAKEVRVYNEPLGTWTWLEDPEGNEFCIERPAGQG